MSQSSIGVPAPATTAATTTAAAERKTGVFLPRFITGCAILLAWEIVVRMAAPRYVAKPTTVVMAIPHVIIDPAFLTATRDTLSAVAEGLAIALVMGTIIGLLMGRSPAVERGIRHYVNGFYAMPMIVVLPLFSLWFGYSGATRIATIIFAAIFSIIINVADRLAGVDALSTGRLPPSRGPRPDRRGGGGILPFDWRARLFHSLQLALLPS
jgi:ABC-type nitrate/sulfonate/bicarbonate transport system permease component